MQIALIAHDSKKELLTEFCIAYCGLMSRHDICATGTTGRLIEEATGLKINKYMAGSQGGDQQIAARINCNEIDLLLFFRDSQHHASEPNDEAMLRLCDANNIPFATNLATAEALIQALENGDLEWRNLVNPLAKM